MAGYQSYPEYKESGVEWLGEVPKHWESAPLRHFLTEPLSNGLFKKREHWGDGTKIVNVFDVYTKGDVVNETSLERVTCDDSELEKYTVKHGDFVFVRSSLKLDGIGKSASVLNPVEPLVFECHLVRGRPDARNIDPKFLCYFLNSGYSRESLVSFSNQVTMATLDQQKFKQLVIAAPPISEQQTIARFLDHKTTQIDALIAKKQTLLEKLSEKRTALISHAVTKGLDPNVKMKDSGVEWLGQVPEHWQVKRLKFLVSSPLKYGANEAAELTDTEFPRYIRITDVNEDGSLKEETFRSLPPEVAKDYLLEDGDILLARSGATVGKTFIYRPSWGVSAYAGYLIRARMSAEMDADFSYYFLQSDIYWQWLNSIFIQATIQNVSAEKYANLWLPVPDKQVQKFIVDYLSKQVERINIQVAKATDAIEKLKEYRSALITQAVTGKIDVRNVKIPGATTEGQAA